MAEVSDVQGKGFGADTVANNDASSAMIKFRMVERGGRCVVVVPAILAVLGHCAVVPVVFRVRGNEAEDFE